MRMTVSSNQAHEGYREAARLYLVPAGQEGPELIILAQGQSPIEMARERAVKTLNAEEIEGMRKVCRVSFPLQAHAGAS